MIIKKLQNNFTTLEQSKRLLELGVSADRKDDEPTEVELEIKIKGK